MSVPAPASANRSVNQTKAEMAKGQGKRPSIKPVDPNAGASFISGFSAGTTTLVTTSKEDCTDTAKLDRSDFTPNFPRAGEKPNDLLQRLYSLWPAQLTASYRPPAVANPEATAEFNLRNIRELYPRRTKSARRKTKAAGVALEAIMRLDRKSQGHYSLSGSGLNLAP